jgi:hypothetical protein
MIFDDAQIWLGIAEPKQFFGPFVRIEGTGFGGNLWNENEPARIKTAFFLEPCFHGNDQFTQTGSGQRQ